MQNLLFYCQPIEQNPLILFLTIQIIVWIALQAAQIQLQNQFQADQIKLILISNWNKTPIVELNISKQCKEAEMNVNFTIPHQNTQCLCQEAMYNQECSQDQLQRQGCLQIQEFNSQTLNYWPFYLRLNTQVPYKLCYQQSDQNTYYNQLKENKCFNDSSQTINQQPISNIKINRTYMVNEYVLQKDSIQLEISPDNPIVGIYLISSVKQTEVDTQKYRIIEQFQAQEVWKTNNISINNKYHPHIYHNFTYYIIAEKYIQLKDQCDCNNQILNTLDQQIDLEYRIVWMSYLQLSFILVYILIIMIYFKFQKNSNILLISLIFEPVLVLLLIYQLNYHFNNIYLTDCFDQILKDDIFTLKLLIIQITIIILICITQLYAILQQQFREFSKLAYNQILQCSQSVYNQIGKQCKDCCIVAQSILIGRKRYRVANEKALQMVCCEQLNNCQPINNTEIQIQQQEQNLE